LSKVNLLFCVGDLSVAFDCPREVSFLLFRFVRYFCAQNEQIIHELVKLLKFV